MAQDLEKRAAGHPLLNVGLVVFLVVMIVGGFALKPILAARNINSLVTRANADLPKMLDSSTRLDRLTANADGVVYHYTIMTDATFEQIRPRVESRLRASYCDQMKNLVRDGFSVEWEYSSRDGTFLGSVIRQASACR